MAAPVMAWLTDALRGLKYGAVHLVVHEGRVVRIERIERMRLTGTPEADSTAGPTDRIPGGAQADEGEA